MNPLKARSSGRLYQQLVNPSLVVAIFHLVCVAFCHGPIYEWVKFIRKGKEASMEFFFFYVSDEHLRGKDIHTSIYGLYGGKPCAVSPGCT